MMFLNKVTLFKFIYFKLLNEKLKTKFIHEKLVLKS